MGFWRRLLGLEERRNFEFKPIEPLKERPKITFIPTGAPTLKFPPRKHIIFSEAVLRAAYLELIQNAPREASGGIFGKYTDDGVCSATSYHDATTYASEAGVEADFIALLKHQSSDKALVALVHSHPWKGKEYANPSEHKDKKTLARVGDRYQYIIITLDGYVRFFGNLSYEIRGDIDRVDKDLYKLKNLDDVQRMLFERLGPRASERIRFERID